MMRFVIKILITALAALLATYLLPGVHIDNFTSALLLAVVLAILNAFIRPVLIVLTLPITLVTLGLFLLVINALIILIAGHFVKGFHVDGFWWALVFSIVLAIISAVMTALGGKVE